MDRARTIVLMILFSMMMLLGTLSLAQPVNIDSTAAASTKPDAKAASVDRDQAPANQTPSEASPTEATSDLWRYLTSNEFALAVLVLLFGALVVISASSTIRSGRITVEQAVRFYGIVVILIGTILLIVAGLSNNQIAPAVGLFGTVAGYLLGRGRSTLTPSADKSERSG